MIALLFSLVLAAPPILPLPEIPPDAEYSPKLVRQWCRDGGLSDAERANVKRLATKWAESHDEWCEKQEAAIVDAMEATWACEPGSAERAKAGDVVYRLQAEMAAREYGLLKKIQKLVKQRGDWPGELA